MLQHRSRRVQVARVHHASGADITLRLWRQDPAVNSTPFDLELGERSRWPCAAQIPLGD